jgi:hypothetical protein
MCDHIGLVEAQVTEPAYESCFRLAAKHGMGFSRMRLGGYFRFNQVT